MLKAIYVGIDTYPQYPLSGCVADAMLWEKTMAPLGFVTQRLLINEEGTRANILAALQTMLAGAVTGDTLLFQYSGHGTQLPDLDGDEYSEDQQDEAMIPYDYTNGAYVIDDDLASIFTGIPVGINLTCFIDCCHSGTISRLDPNAKSQPRARFVRATVAMQHEHRRFRQALGQAQALPTRPQAIMKEIVFSACRADEVAWENNGHGDFTRKATAVLETNGLTLTNERLSKLITNAFGKRPKQHPILDCKPANLALPLFAPCT